MGSKSMGRTVGSAFPLGTAPGGGASPRWSPDSCLVLSST